MKACVTKMWNIVSTGKKGIKLTDIGKCCVYRQKDKKMTDTGKCCVHRRKGRRRLLPSLRMVVVLWWRPGKQPSHFFSILQHGFNPHTFILTQSNIMPWTPAPVWSSWTARQPKICDAAEQLEEDFLKKVRVFFFAFFTLVSRRKLALLFVCPLVYIPCTKLFISAPTPSICVKQHKIGP